MKQTILIVEDDLDNLAFLQTALDSSGFHPLACTDGEDALQVFGKQAVDLILLDIQLTGIDGFSVCEHVRQTSDVPIIFISSLTDGSDIVRGLELGGDDYVTKPFDLRQLTARIHANLRRSLQLREQLRQSVQGDEWNVGKMNLNLQLQRVSVAGEHVQLSQKEFHILTILARQPGTTWNAHELYRLVWGVDSLGDVRTLKVHISHLRKKMQDYPEFVIEAVRGYGYRLRH